MTMVKVYSKALEQTIETGRYIGKLEGAQPGPSLVFTAGLHGNEPSGVFALKRAIKLLEDKELPIKGNVYALAGNLPALERGERYHRHDLNRLWSGRRMSRICKGLHKAENEDEIQQQELYQCIREILVKDQGPFYFMDLHTTSCETVPFIVVNDSLLNRKFTSQYPLPMILGIEEFLEGPLLSYINELGYVAFGFEAGQHDELSAIENHIAFIMLSLAFTGCITKKDLDFNRYYNVLAKTSVDTRHFYEIFYRYRIRHGEQFQMEPGYVNFQNVKIGQKLATSNGDPILANRNAKVFMPLYQSQGSEGFFAIRRVDRRFLNTSAALRRMKLNHMLPLLPGVSWLNRQRGTLKVDRRIAKFFTKKAFHLLGYRSRKLDRNHYIMKNRETASRNEDYKNAGWL